MNTQMNRYSVLVNGVEVNNYILTYDEAVNLKESYLEDNIEIALISKIIHYIDNNIFYYVDDDNNKYKVESLDSIDNKYYFSLFCLQTHDYLHSGCNTQNINDLLNEYWLYKSADFDIEYYQSLSLEEQLNILFDDEFELHLNLKKNLELSI